MSGADEGALFPEHAPRFPVGGAVQPRLVDVEPEAVVTCPACGGADHEPNRLCAGPEAALRLF